MEDCSVEFSSVVGMLSEFSGVLNFFLYIFTSAGEREREMFKF